MPLHGSAKRRSTARQIYGNADLRYSKDRNVASMDAARYRSMVPGGLDFTNRRRPGGLRGPGHAHRDVVNEISVERRNGCKLV